VRNETPRGFPIIAQVVYLSRKRPEKRRERRSRSAAAAVVTLAPGTGRRGATASVAEHAEGRGEASYFALSTLRTRLRLRGSVENEILELIATIPTLILVDRHSFS
jgi:hypothetical protein